MNTEYARAKAQRYGNHFFDADTMRFFNSRILSSSWTKVGEGEWLFITSERFDDGEPDAYTVRSFRLDDVAGQADTETIGDFQGHATSADAYRAMRERARN